MPQDPPPGYRVEYHTGRRVWRARVGWWILQVEWAHNYWDTRAEAVEACWSLYNAEQARKGRWVKDAR